MAVLLAQFQELLATLFKPFKLGTITLIVPSPALQDPIGGVEHEQTFCRTREGNSRLPTVRHPAREG